MPMMLETGADGTAQFVTPTCNRPVAFTFPRPSRSGPASADHLSRPQRTAKLVHMFLWSCPHKCDETPRCRAPHSAAHRARFHVLRFPTRAESEPRTLTVCCVLRALPLETVSDAGPRSRAQLAV